MIGRELPPERPLPVGAFCRYRLFAPFGIAKKCLLARRGVDKIIEDGKASRLKDNAITEQPPIYNVWNYGNCDPPRWGESLLEMSLKVILVCLAGA